MDVGVVGDVVAVIAQRRGTKRQQPYRGDPEVLKVVELLRQSAEVADAIRVAVKKGAHVNFIDDRVFVPGQVGREIHDVLTCKETMLRPSLRMFNSLG